MCVLVHLHDCLCTFYIPSVLFLLQFIAIETCSLQVVGVVASGRTSTSCGVSCGSRGAKELHYVLRVLAPVACRQPYLFPEVVSESLRIQIPATIKSGVYC